MLSIATQGRVFRRTFVAFERQRAAVWSVLVDLITVRRRDPDLEARRRRSLDAAARLRDEDGVGFDDIELRDELMTILLAGHDTTATALAWDFDLLADHRQLADHLCAELQAGRDEYLDATVKEVLRLRPVVPEVNRRLTIDTEIGGWVIPAGTEVSANIYLAHHRSEDFPQPDAFRPERFEGAAPAVHAWHPFGGGVRRCLGVAFANLELRTVLRMVAGRLAIQPVRAPEKSRRRAVTLVPRHGAPVIITNRR